jgi:sec-independent protein translocase protein TatB
MNVFGVGPLEMLLIAIIAVIVLGPERFPEMAVQVARVIKFLRGYATDATSQLRQELEELTREYEEMRKELDDFRKGIRADMSTVTQEVNRALEETQPILEPGGEAPPEKVSSSEKPNSPR